MTQTEQTNAYRFELKEDMMKDLVNALGLRIIPKNDDILIDNGKTWPRIAYIGDFYFSKYASQHFEFINMIQWS